MSDIKKQIKSAVMAGFIDKNDYTYQDEFSPKLLFNSSDDKIKTHIDEELSTCKSFTFAVAFITEAVLTMLKPKFADLAAKGIKGRILTSNYLGFNNPKVFKELLKIPNLSVRILDEQLSFHAKGYIFNKGAYQSIIVGSSNLTETALIKNYEWNLRITSYENGELTKQIIDEVEKQWSQANELTSSWISMYEKVFEPFPIFKEKKGFVEELNEISTIDLHNIKPNKMQIEATDSIDKIRKAGKHKGLVVSATGTGKTYLGAFDVRNYHPKRFLFIVHREQILRKALESFHKVIGGNKKDYGILSGNEKNLDSKYLFATIQTISKENVMTQFDPEEFDYIMIDEAHKSGANSYQRIINYFKPDFLLGMTATPERTDDFNIYELFDYNLAFEIRLQEALEDDMLCPFHYIGVTDYEFNGEMIDDQTNLKYLVSEERMDYVVSQINYYGHSGKQVHGLIFCARKDEAYEIAEIMNQRGYRSTCLTGEDTVEEREKVILKFENGQLDYIVTVDVFNEGIDIPCINQVIMLRNTQSSIVFIQQLGRGLRKFTGKDFVTVIDFIGNYKNNYLIPIALSGDNSRNKNSIRSKLTTDQIIGISTINFTEVAKERIYESINKSNLTELKLIREDYLDLKNRLGRIPTLFDFSSRGSIDAQVLVDKFSNYYKFLLKMKEELHLNIFEEKILTMLSNELMNGKRCHELILLQSLLKSDSGSVSKTFFLKQLVSRNIRTDDKTLTSMMQVLSLAFYKKADIEKFGGLPFVSLFDDKYQLNEEILKRYTENKFFKWFIDDVLKTGLFKSKQYNQQIDLTIGKKYTRKDACRILGWPTDQASVMYGYKEGYGTCPIFITYSKKIENEDVINYEDEFLNSGVMRMFTRHPRRLDSKEVNSIIEGDLSGKIKIPLFVKKSDDEGTDFYFLGMVHIDQKSIKQEYMMVNEKQEPVVTMNLLLENPVEYSLYLNFVKK